MFVLNYLDSKFIFIFVASSAKMWFGFVLFEWLFIVYVVIPTCTLYFHCVINSVNIIIWATF